MIWHATRHNAAGDFRHGKTERPLRLVPPDAFFRIEAGFYIGVAVGIPDTGDDLGRVAGAVGPEFHFQGLSVFGM